MVSPIGTKVSEEHCYMGTYHSTRGRTLSCSSKVAIRTGIDPDGGLFVSDELGTQQVDISSLADKSYFEIAQNVLGMLLNDYTDEEISACVDEAYRGTFASEEVTPLVKLDAAPGTDAPQTYVMELFGGPTSAFKDVALQMLPRLMARTSAKDGGAERIMIVTATSGDTGKAALAGFADAPGTGITVFYPEGKVSRVQNLQMSTQEGDNVAVCGIRGNFDDAQSAVKRIFADKELAERLEAAGTVLSSANSINVWYRRSSTTLPPMRSCCAPAPSRPATPWSSAYRPATLAISWPATMPSAWVCPSPSSSSRATRTTCWLTS